MANENHLKVLRSGVSAWNKWRKENPRIAPNLLGAELGSAELNGANLSEANLHKADLSEAQLQGANLAGSILTRAILNNAKISGADLRGAHLTSANLSLACLRQADLGKADITAANLTRAELSESKMQRAIANRTVFANVDLSDVVGLKDVQHLGPSTIGIDTLYKSNGRIPEEFLRGAGTPDNLIAFAKSLVTNPIEFYSCFISYSTKDQDFANRLYADLQAKGVRCWFAPRDAQRGRKLHEQIDEAIRMHEKLLLILSPDSMNSTWVKTEIANTRAREQREGVQMLFPVSIVPYSAIRDWKCFDSDTGIDSAREIREYLIADFSNWKEHDSYQKEFDLLLRDLQSQR